MSLYSLGEGIEWLLNKIEKKTFQCISFDIRPIG